MGEGGAWRGPARGRQEASEGAQGKERAKEGRGQEDGAAQASQQEGKESGEEETLGHLAPRVGVVFRIDFADHAVAAVALGGVEAGVGALDQ